MKKMQIQTHYLYVHLFSRLPDIQAGASSIRTTCTNLIKAEPLLAYIEYKKLRGYIIYFPTRKDVTRFEGQFEFPGIEDTHLYVLKD